MPNAKYYQKNKERLKREQKENYKKNKAAVLARNKRWNDANPDKMKKASEKWVKENPEKSRARHKRYQRKNRELVRARCRDYQKRNPEVFKAISSKRRTAKTKAGGSFTAVEWKALCDKYDNRCLCCGKRRKLTADHVIPVSKGGTSNIDNIQPLCRACNSSKKDKTIDYRKREEKLCIAKRQS